MDPSHLEEDEISYECNLRSMPPVITRHRIQILAERLAMEYRGEMNVPNRNLNPDAAFEVNVCGEKLTEIDCLMYVVCDTNNADTMTKIISRLSHISGRLDRTMSDNREILYKINLFKKKIFYYVNMLTAAVAGKIILKDHLKMDDEFFSGACGGQPAPANPVTRPLTPLVKNTGTVPKTDEATAPVLNVIREEVSADGATQNKTSSVQGNPGTDGGHDLSARFDSFNLNDEQLDSEIMALSNPFGYVPLPSKRNQNSGSQSNLLFTKQPTKFTTSNRSFEPSSYFGNQAGPRVEDNREPKGARETQGQFHSVLKRPQRVVEPKVGVNKNTNQAGNTPYPAQQNYAEPYPIYENPRNANVRHKNPICSWNLVFSGDGKGGNVNQFLRQVELTARADRVSHAELLESAIHLFVGPARSWYIAFEVMFHSWDELTRALRQNFISEDSDFLLLKEIETRHQGKDEPFVLYLSGMLNLFHHLKEPLSERKKVDMVMRNMNPFLADRVALLDIRDIHHLALLCKKIEDVRTRSKSFRQTPTEQYPVNQPKRYVSEVQRDPSPNHMRSQTEMRCVNCRESGHIFVDCKRPKMRVFCYICGELGQLANNCDTCPSKPKNVATRSKPNAWDGIEM